MMLAQDKIQFHFIIRSGQCSGGGIIDVVLPQLMVRRLRLVAGSLGMERIVSRSRVSVQ